MLESIKIPSLGLEQGLAELETLGLLRPASVLLAEYLQALVAEDLLDKATAEQVSAAYNSVRYAAVPPNDPQVREAVASLDQLAAKLALMSPEDRHEIAQRLQGRMQLTTTEPAVDLLADSDTPVPTARGTRASRNGSGTRAAVHPSGSRSAFSDSLDFSDSLSRPKHRRSPLPRGVLVLSTLTALATFFGGYFFRETINKRAEAGDDFSKTRVSLELVLAYEPNNPVVLNDLAGLYLIPDQSGGSRPKRALQLVERALEIKRVPAILDTAAEAQFQCGNVREAIRLQGESIRRASQRDPDQQHRQQQLAKFQRAAEVRTAERAPVSPIGPSRLSAETGAGRIQGPIGSEPSRLGGS